MTTFPIYLDYHATTPTDIRVYNKMRPFFYEHFGNPASLTHAYGVKALDAINEARYTVSQAINAHPSEIVFTSGATESNNMAIKGLLLPLPLFKDNHIISSAIDHQATLAPLYALKDMARVSLVKPDQDGIITAANLAHYLSDDTTLISLFMAHNEVGSINPIKELNNLAKTKKILFHCDAVQAMGRIPIDVVDLGVDFLSLSAHKIYGPKGVGCLFIKSTLMDKLCPLIHGGGQEWHKRSGTLNVPGIIGFAEAMRLATLNMAIENETIMLLRDRLLHNLMTLPDIHINGGFKQRLSANLHVSFLGIDGPELILALRDKVAISSGSACSLNNNSSNKVLKEMDIAKEWHKAAIRFGIGRYTSKEDIDVASEIIINQVKKQRKTTGKNLIKIA